MPNHHNKKKHKSKRKPHNDSNNNRQSVDTVNMDGLAIADEVNENPNPEPRSHKPYRIAKSDVMGRYLVANRDLRAGELIIKVDPVAVGPCAESNPVCLGCSTDLPRCQKKVHKCKNCGWPLCGAKCRGIKKDLGHSTYECDELRKHRVSDFLQDCSEQDASHMYEAILALRCLLLKNYKPELWEKLNEMESHNELRRGIPALWSRNQKIIVDRIRKDWKFEEFTEEEVHTVCGILEVNSFEVGTVGCRARALFPEAFYISHECSPNTTHTDHPRNHAISLRMTKDIREGEMISLSYSYTLQGTLKRRQHLKDSKFFWCECRRCKDPTELGTFTSALQCPNCNGGYILTTNPLDQDAPWKCQKCERTLTGKDVLSLVDNLFEEMETVDPNATEGYEAFLSKYRNVLHKNHYLNLSAKHNLCQLYGRTASHMLQDMSPEELSRKETICRDLLEVIDILEPGLSRLRGVVMYELHAPLMMQARKLFESRKISTNDLKNRLKEVVNLLRESEKILSFEPEGTQEADMAMGAKDALMRLGNSVNF
ncbi:SET domain-containing protein SmydA-8-like [Culicoides brevitarsis]|uniref:SET domain-containing protein SmydA-8-like n=1 Tax=Culicoides brevitarsis TaxID=469753 RepID=UPI00307B10DB